jgi:hypothetical protein
MTKIALFALVLTACSGTLPPLDATDDLGPDGGAAAMDMPPAASDGGGGFGANCALDSDCATGHCFLGNSRHFCTMPCTPATAAMDCPNPPTSGTCNMRGFCKP